ncbi:hypothetical protein PSCLAVI8L_260003 [Pseudoclavibacter sp. 8L]|nr:hypothetical protein PSCLAVI8L_260003 [Pseudoclavibacter sp. 8L]
MSAAAALPGRTGRTRTSMTPPQLNPTENAAAALYPKVSTLAAPLWIASRHCSKTAPSTHPPDTLPNTSPSADTIMLAPTSRGALPLTATSVAIANGRPRRDHSAPIGRIPRMTKR